MQSAKWSCAINKHLSVGKLHQCGGCLSTGVGQARCVCVEEHRSSWTCSPPATNFLDQTCTHLSRSCCWTLPLKKQNGRPGSSSQRQQENKQTLFFHLKTKKIIFISLFMLKRWYFCFVLFSSVFVLNRAGIAAAFKPTLCRLGCKHDLSLSLQVIEFSSNYVTWACAVNLSFWLDGC